MKLTLPHPANSILYIYLPKLPKSCNLLCSILIPHFELATSPNSCWGKRIGPICVSVSAHMCILGRGKNMCVCCNVTDSWKNHLLQKVVMRLSMIFLRLFFLKKSEVNIESTFCGLPWNNLLAVLFHANIQPGCSKWVNSIPEER